MKSKKKTPNDYPLFGYRVFPETKETLSQRLEDVRDLLNDRRRTTEKPLKKNDVFIKALVSGLERLEKEVSKK